MNSLPEDKLIAGRIALSKEFALCPGWKGLEPTS